MKKMDSKRGLVMALALLISAVSAQAGKFPYPTVDFSADLTMAVKQNGGSQPYVMHGKIFSTEGSERREMESMGRKTVIIHNRKTGEQITLMPEQKMYMIDKDDSRRDPERMIRDGELKLTKKNKEKLKGHSTTKYEMTSTSESKEQFNGFVWLTRQNIPVRITATATEGGRSHDVQIDYDNINIGKQPSHLFKITPGYRQLNMGMPTGAPAGLGGAPGKLPPGMTPEQIEQLKKMFQQNKE